MIITVTGTYASFEPFSFEIPYREISLKPIPLSVEPKGFAVYIAFAVNLAI